MTKPTLYKHFGLPTSGISSILITLWAMENFLGFRLGGGPAREPMTFWIPVAGILVGALLCWIYYRQRLSLFEHGVDVSANLVRFTGGGGALVKYEFAQRSYQKMVDIPAHARTGLAKGSPVPVRVHKLKPGRVQFAGELAL